MIVCVVIIFFFSYVFGSENPQTIIIHMPGILDSGLQFLNTHINYAMPSEARFTNQLNESKTVHPCDKLENTAIYTNNLSYKDMDFGGKACINFYKNMILDMYEKYPQAKLILTGGSQGSVGPFGALAKLIKQRHPVVQNITKIAVIAALGSTHKIINFNFAKYQLMKYLPFISKKIAPLLTEYFLPLPFFPFILLSKYDAFAKQMEHYIQDIKKSECDIPVFIMHDTHDCLIPVQCTEDIASLNNNYYIELTSTAHHVPDFDAKNQQTILDFLQKESFLPIINKKSEITPLVDNWFISKSPSQQFMIRRTRDILLLTTLFGAFKSIKFISLLLVLIYKKMDLYLETKPQSFVKKEL